MYFACKYICCTHVYVCMYPCMFICIGALSVFPVKLYITFRAASEKSQQCFSEREGLLIDCHIVQHQHVHRSLKKALHQYKLHLLVAYNYLSSPLIDFFFILIRLFNFFSFFTVHCFLKRHHNSSFLVHILRWFCKSSCDNYFKFYKYSILVPDQGLSHKLTTGLSFLNYCPELCYRLDIINNYLL